MATRRPDLEAMPAKFPNYLTPLLFPFMRIGQKAGTIYYSDIQADGTAETDRVLGANPDSAAMQSSSTTYAMAEKVLDIYIDKSEIALLGGLDAAQAKAGRKAKRAVMDAVEALTAANVLGNASANTGSVTDSLIQAIQDAKETIMDLGEGRVALVGSQKVINWIKRYDEVEAKMAFTGVLPGNVRDVRSISNDQLAAALDVDLVLGGPLATWYTASASYQDAVALVILPDEASMPDEELQVGRSLVYPVGGNDPNNLVELSTFATDRPPAEWCRGQIWIDQEIFNPELIYILDGLADPASTTTTTTAGATTTAGG